MTKVPDLIPTGPSDPADLAAQSRLSRNEIEMLCLKAARGAGMPWGLAEEAGFAAGWLAAHGVEGTTPLLDHLASTATGYSAAVSQENRHWQGVPGQRLCPIAFGATLDDHAILDAGPCANIITSSAVSWPILILPFLGRIAQATDQPLVLQWDQGRLVIWPNRTGDNVALQNLSQIAQSPLTIGPISQSGTAPIQAKPPAAIPVVPGHTLAGLNVLSMRTTVPASEASRRGAGATAGDND